MRLNELFAAIAWPVSEIDTSFPPSTTGAGLAAQATEAIEVDDVVTEIGPDGTVTLTGTLSLVAGTPPTRTRLVSHLFPSLGFTFVPKADWTSAFRVSIGLAGGSTVQIDVLPLEVAVPSDLLGAHPDPAKQGADAGVQLSTGAGDSVISREFSFLLDAGQMIHLEPHLPISVGPCSIFGAPAIAVHEITLISSIAQARDQVDWLRRDLDQGMFAFRGGSLGFGGIELDFDEPGTVLRDLQQRIHLSEQAAVVLEDLVVPSVLWPPLPQHGTLGVRRSLQPGETLDHYLSFTDAPIVVPLGTTGRHLFLSQLFFITPEQEADWWTGLTLEGGLAWPDSGQAAPGDFELSVGLVDGDVLRIGFEHTPAGSHIPILHLDLWKLTVDITGVKTGVSLQELMRRSPSPGAAIQFLVTIVIKEKPGPGAGAAGAVTATPEGGGLFEAALVDVGWDRGKPTGNMVMPHGAELHLATFVLEMHEMGLASEHGAIYMSFSGGIRLGIGTFEGRAWFTRLRGRFAGNPDAPVFQLGGIGLEIKVKNVVEISAHGMYRDDTGPNGTRLQEKALGGGIIVYCGDNEWGLTLDLYWGTRTPPGGPGDKFFLFLLAFFGAIPMGGAVQLTGIEVLFAHGLMPKIDAGDRQAGELKYYSWLKRARPTALPETRDLDSSWTPTKDSWAFGLGAGVSITGAGSLIKIRAFGAGFDSPSVSGLIIVIELQMFGAETPIAVGVFEYDFRHDAFVLMIQLDITIDKIVKNLPKKLNLRLGGTITFGNKPGLVAFGRLADPDTWIGGKLLINLSEVFALTMRAGFCVEWQENEHIGGGLTISLKVVGSIGVMEFQGWGALEIILTYMLTGTNDFVARIRFDAGMAIVLFGFIRFGISIALLAEWLAHVPNYFVFRVTFRFETPWFLPDVSYSIEVTRGTLVPSARGVTTSPLTQAGSQALTGSSPARVQRADGRAGGEPTALASVDDLAGATGTWQGSAAPVPLDATIEVDFSVMLVDALGIGATNPDLGLQVSGDGSLALTTRYTLTRLIMRRRPLSGGAWQTVEDLNSSASARNFRWTWAQDTRVGGKVAPKRLLLNGRTPFTVGVNVPIADAEILDDNPNYPCCQVRRPDVARFDFDPEPRGPLPAGFTRDFRYEDRGTTAPVRMHGAPCAVVLPTAAGSTAGRVGSFAATGTIFTASASEDLAAAIIRVAVTSKDRVRLALVTLDRDGREVDRQQVTTGALAFQEFAIDPGAPFATVFLAVETIKEEGPQAPVTPGTVLLDAVECITVADRDRFERESDICSRESGGGTPPTVTFLARHEYEIALTTEVAIKHSVTEWESSTVTEKVAFTTAGPPGLNAAPEPGLELEPHVVSRAPGGRGLTYGEESVHLVLSEALSIFGPGSGVTEAALRLPVAIAVESAFDANPQAHVGKTSRTSADWFLTHRGEADPFVQPSRHDYVPAVSKDAAVLRYLRLAEASSGTCPVQDVEQLPRVGVEPFDPTGRSLWEPGASYVAVMRLAGSPVVERTVFEDSDLTAFTAVSGSWQVTGGALAAAGASTGAFGETTWDLYRVELQGSIDQGGAIGVMVLAGGPVADAVHAAVVRAMDDSVSLVVRNGAGTVLGSVPLAAAGQSSALTVDVFADVIRARCGDAVLDFPRGNRGTGSCVLTSSHARVTSLRVHGVDMYRRPFRTSRYEGFAEHVASCAGVERHHAGSAAEPLATLLARITGAAAAAMTPTAPAADRERCFANAAAALAVPLREDSDRLHITLMSGGTDRWLLLESPEPMDFTEEITLRLLRREVHEALTAADKARLGPLIEAALQIPPTGPQRPAGWATGARRLVIPTRSFGILDGPGARKSVYRASLDGKFLTVVELATGATARFKAPALTPADRALLQDVFVVLNGALRIIAWQVPTSTEWIPETATVLQDAPALHTLVLPATSLASGVYRLDLSLTRRWFDTTDPLGPDNAYLDEASVEVLVA
ncbi:hypothetical protein ABZ490_49770 [Streptomyces sp. NPDC005811]|uniref:hypothetical protein n=1 Tax=Streptomyces sp. NPDC005811 TaxID=3154565 RepID=UPI0033F4B1E9